MIPSPALRARLDAVAGYPVGPNESLDIEMARYCLWLEHALNPKCVHYNDNSHVRHAAAGPYVWQDADSPRIAP